MLSKTNIQLPRLRIFLRIFLLLSTLICNASNKPAQQEGLWNQITPLITSSLLTQTLTDHELLTICGCNALQKHGLYHKSIDSELLQTFNSLKIFSHIAPNLAKTHLYIGNIVFTKNFTQITDDLKKLKAQQKTLSFLQNNPKIVNELEGLIKSLQPIEIKLLWNFYPGQTSHPRASMYQSLCKKFENALTNNKLTHPYKSYIMMNWHEYVQRAKVLAAMGLCYQTASYLCNLKKSYPSEIEIWTLRLKQYRNDNNDKQNLLVDNSNLQQSNYMPSIKTIAAIVLAYKCIGLIMTSFQFGEFVKQDFDDAYEKQKSLIELHHLMDATIRLRDIIKQNPELSDALEHAEIIEQFASYQQSDNKLDPELIKFLKLLDSRSFKGKPSYYLSLQGKIIEVHNEFTAIKHHFIPLWEAIGDIDAQLSTIKILTESPKNAFCQPVWIDAQYPELVSNNFWHPYINHEKVIKNSIAIGKVHNAPNILITGSNAGGKTTTLAALMIGQIMAQSIGIAPAKSLHCTPFAQLHTYLDIATNLAENESLFMAQANRAEKLQNSIKTCLPKQKSFSILDEIFTGTRADFASQASFEFAQQLGSMPQSMCILATHFPQLTQLENLKQFINYKTADAYFNQNHELIYTYKIMPGVSEQNIAKYILQQKGIIHNV